MLLASKISAQSCAHVVQHSFLKSMSSQLGSDELQHRNLTCHFVWRRTAGSSSSVRLKKRETLQCCECNQTPQPNLKIQKRFHRGPKNECEHWRTRLRAGDVADGLTPMVLGSKSSGFTIRRVHPNPSRRRNVQPVKTTLGKQGGLRKRPGCIGTHSRSGETATPVPSLLLVV